MPEPGQLARPVMRAGVASGFSELPIAAPLVHAQWATAQPLATFHADQAWRQALEELQHLASPQLTMQGQAALDIGLEKHGRF